MTENMTFKKKDHINVNTLRCLIIPILIDIHLSQLLSGNGTPF